MAADVDVALKTEDRNEYEKKTLRMKKFRNLLTVIADNTQMKDKLVFKIDKRFETPFYFIY